MSSDTAPPTLCAGAGGPHYAVPGQQVCRRHGATKSTPTKENRPMGMTATVEVHGTTIEDLAAEARRVAAPLFPPGAMLGIDSFTARPHSRHLDGTVGLWEADVTVWAHDDGPVFDALRAPRNVPASETRP